MAQRANTVATLRSGLKVTVGYYTSITDIDADAKKAGAALHLCNTYMQQKSALPEANAFIVDILDKLSPPFVPDPKKNKTVVVKGKDGAPDTTVVENSETELERQKRFIAAVDGGHVTYDGISKGGSIAWLQSQLDKHGVFNLDASAPVRVAKAKTPPQSALKGAQIIFDNNAKKPGFLAHWLKKFDAEGFPVVGYQDIPKNATPEDAAKVLDANKTAIAWSIYHREEAKRAAAAEAEFSAPVK